jgi:hypothetical protein
MGDITVSTNTPGCSLFNVKAKTEAESGSPDPSHDYPYGLVEFCVSCAAANVTITFPGSVDGMPYRKYGPTTPGDEGTRGWYTFSDVTQSGNVVTLQLKDGQLGDDTGVDGVIVDQGGPAQQQGAEPGPTAIPTLNEWGIIILMALLGLVSIHYLRRLERA